MKKKNVSVYNVKDFKNIDGEWVRSYTETTEKYYIQYNTRAGKLWNKVQDRCKVGGAVQNLSKTYVGVENHFESFQAFAEWCQHKFGYDKIDTSGKYWHLDKDLKVWGNKFYSEDFCLFVPQRINCLLNTPVKPHGETYFTGASYNKQHGKYLATCLEYSTGRTIRLGGYTNIEDAHAAWQKEKANQFYNASLDNEINSEIKDVLLKNRDRLLYDLKNGIETHKRGFS